MNISSNIAILLILYETKEEETNQVYSKIIAEVKKRYPKACVRPVFFVRKVLPTPSSVSELFNLLELGFSKIIVQPFYIIPGQEYHELIGLISIIRQISKLPQLQIITVKPLLVDNIAVQKTAKALYHLQSQNLNCKNSGSETAILYIGHGSMHGANLAYSALQHFFLKEDKKARLQLACLLGKPELSEALSFFKEKGIKKIRLCLLMTTKSGKHVQRDILGYVYEQIKAAGFEVELDLQGLCELDSVLEIWFEHLTEAELQLI